MTRTVAFVQHWLHIRGPISSGEVRHSDFLITERNPRQRRQKEWWTGGKREGNVVKVMFPSFSVPNSSLFTVISISSPSYKPRLINIHSSALNPISVIGNFIVEICFISSGIWPVPRGGNSSVLLREQWRDQWPLCYVAIRIIRRCVSALFDCRSFL